MATATPKNQRNPPASVWLEVLHRLFDGAHGLPLQARAGLVSYRQIDELFAQTGAILTKFSLPYRGDSVALDLPGAKDYDQLIDLLAASGPITESA